MNLGRRAFSGGLVLAACTRRSSSEPPAALPPPIEGSIPVDAGVDPIPHVKLGSFPTPVTRAGSLWLKRDDQSGAIYGGGKTRKLERLLADAIARKCPGIATMGGLGSNHALATALYGKSLGLEVGLVLLGEPASDETRSHVRVEKSSGAHVVMGTSQKDAEALARSTWPDFAWIPAGGTSPLGNVGFVDAGRELAAQIRAGDLPKPDRIYMAMGTMGSAVGLSIGLRAAGIDSKVIAVRASNPPTSSLGKLHALHEDTVRFLRSFDPGFPDLAPDDDALRIDGRHLGAGYAIATQEGDAAMKRAPVPLEHVYTAKAFAALLADAPAGNVLFWVSNDPRAL